MPNQNPADPEGANAFGRWDYGPWFWPPLTAAAGLVHGEVLGTGTNGCPAGVVCPGTPNPSLTPEAFMDTPVVNGTAYPFVVVQPKAYRLRILNASNDRFLNLQLYRAEPLTIQILNGGTGYSATPTIAITDATGTGATATAQVTGVVKTIAVGTAGTGYTAPPVVVLTGGGGAGATATAMVAGGLVTGIAVTNGGAGYTSAPAVALQGGAGTGAVATATVVNTIVAIQVTAPGTGYSRSPTVTITDATGTGAIAIASAGTEVKMVEACPHNAVPAVTVPADLPLCPSGVTTGVPAAITGGVAYSGTGCWPATWPTDGRDGGVPDPTTVGPAMVQIGTEGGFLPQAVVLDNTPVGYNYNRRDITVLNVLTHTLFLGPAERADVVVDFSAVPPGTTLILYNDAPAPVPAFDPRIDYYTGDPDQTMSGGAPSTIAGYGPNTRTWLQIKVAGTPAAPFNLAALQAAIPVAFAASQNAPIIPQPAFGPAYGTTYAGTYSRIQDTILQYTPPATSSVQSVTLTAPGAGYSSAPAVTFTGTGTGAAAVATINGGVTNINILRGGTGYDPAATTVTITGGGGTGATATLTITRGVITDAGVGNPGSGYTVPPVVTITGAGTGALAQVTIDGPVDTITITNGGTGYTTAPTIALTGGGGAGATATASLTRIYNMKPKAIQELFELNYGRMNATLGVELPLTSFLNQTTIPLGYVDPLTEILHSGEPQVWKITHNGVDTHAIHFHLFDVQLINRVGWDGMVKPPEANEVSWKETVRMNPLEDAIVALRPMVQTLPFKLPDSVRLLDPTTPEGTTGQFMNIDPLTNTPVTVTNVMTNFGWEYVWHCHLLGHEENDMMRPMSMQV